MKPSSVRRPARRRRDRLRLAKRLGATPVDDGRADSRAGSRQLRDPVIGGRAAPSSVASPRRPGPTEVLPEPGADGPPPAA